MSKPTMETERQTLTVSEAGKLLGWGRNAAYQAVKRGDLPVLPIGGRMRVSRRAVLAMLEPTKKEASHELPRA